MVLDMDGNDAIIGLPAILGELFDFFITTMLSYARERSMRNSEFVVNKMVESVNNDLMDASNYPIEGPAPEGFSSLFCFREGFYENLQLKNSVFRKHDNMTLIT